MKKTFANHYCLSVIFGLLLIVIGMSSCGLPGFGSSTDDWNVESPQPSGSDTLFRVRLNERKEIWLDYYPYPLFGENLTSASLSTVDEVYPFPRYFGWTDERIRRDIERIQYMGVKVICLNLTPSEIVDQGFQSRLLSFSGICSEFNLKVALCITSASNGLPPSSQIELSIENLCGYLSENKLVDDSFSYCIGSQYIIVIDSSICPNDTPSLGDFCIVSKNLLTGNQSPDFQPLPPAGDFPVFHQVNLSYKTRSSRKTLTEMVSQSIEHELSTAIFIHSWNNYSDGSFIEPNTLDQSRVFNLFHDCLVN